MQTEVLFLTLNVFSATGGIEKVCRVAGKAFYENSLREQYRFQLYSLHDAQESATANPYFPELYFKGFDKNKQRFVRRAVRQGSQSRVVILSHINLLFPAWLIKKFSPRTKILLLAHGIEIWNTLPRHKKIMLNCVDEFLCVSDYTQQKIQETHGIPATKCTVLNNCLDPFLPLPQNIKPGAAFYEKFNCQPGDKIILTLTRLAFKEKYKGYDLVLKALQKINDPKVKYILAGKYEPAEYAHLQDLIKHFQLEAQVILPGFIPEAEVGSLFSIATVYAMPSSKEGFGIVFIEAMYYGLPVLAGNADGSVDALLNGALGTLVNPQEEDEITEALKKSLEKPEAHKPDQALLCEHFSYEVYKSRLNKKVKEHLTM